MPGIYLGYMDKGGISPYHDWPSFLETGKTPFRRPWCHLWQEAGFWSQPAVLRALQGPVGQKAHQGARRSALPGELPSPGRRQPARPFLPPKWGHHTSGVLV